MHMSFTKVISVFDTSLMSAFFKLRDPLIHTLADLSSLNECFAFNHPIAARFSIFFFSEINSIQQYTVENVVSQMLSINYFCIIYFLFNLDFTDNIYIYRVRNKYNFGLQSFSSDGY